MQSIYKYIIVNSASFPFEEARGPESVGVEPQPLCVTGLCVFLCHDRVSAHQVTNR